jgi:hypothetical protein
VFSLALVCSRLSPIPLPTLQEQTVVNAFTADLYVATLNRLSLRCSVTSGFDGHHELVLGGYSQVSAFADTRQRSGVVHSSLPWIAL